MEKERCCLPVLGAPPCANVTGLCDEQSIQGMMWIQGIRITPLKRQGDGFQYTQYTLYLLRQSMNHDMASEIGEDNARHE